MQLYAIHVEGRDDQTDVLYFTDRTNALDALIKTHLENDMYKVTVMYVFMQEDPKQPMVLTESIEPVWDYFNGYRMKKTMERHGITKEMALANPKLLYADLKTVANNAMERDL